jgi:hypothetical protein
VLPTPERYGRPLAWTSDDRSILWYGSGRPGALYRLDVDTGGATRLVGPGVGTDDDVIRLNVPLLSARRLVVRAEYPTRYFDGGEGVGDVRFHVLDLDTGRVRPAPEFCAHWPWTIALIHEGGSLLYPACPNSTDGGELRAHDLDSGSERTVAAFDGQIWRVTASPTGNMMRVMVRNVDESGEQSRYREFIVDLDGDVRRVELPQIADQSSQWDINRWLDDTHLLLERRPGPGFAYAKFDPRTNELELIVGNR